MIINKPGQNEPSNVIEAHDPDAKKTYQMVYGAPSWAALTAYICNEAVVAPSTFNGFYYEAQSGGITASGEPTWPTQAGGTVTDGTVIWRAVCWDLFLGNTETLTVSAWTANVALTMENETLANPITSVRVTAVPSGITEFMLTNHVTKSNGDEDDRSIIVQVMEL